MHTFISDEDLIGDIRANRGKEEAYEELHRRYRGKVERFFLSKRYPGFRAEELAQDVFLEAFTLLSTFRGRSTFRSWLFAIAANMHRGTVRFKNRDKRQAITTHLGSDANRVLARILASDTPNPEQELSQEQDVLAFKAAIDRLPERRRRCLLLKIDGLKVRDIGIQLGISEGAVKAHLHLARQQLQENIYGS